MHFCITGKKMGEKSQQCKKNVSFHVFLLSPVFCEGIKTQNEFDKMSYTCTIAYLEKFFLLHVLQKSVIKHLSFLKKRKK